MDSQRVALEAVLEMNQAILGGLPLRRLLVIIARQAYALVGTSLTVACTPAADGRGLAVRSAIGRRATRLLGWTIPIELAEVEALAGPERIDLSTEPWSGYLPTDVGAGMGPGILVPLRAQERTMGLLLLGNRIRPRSISLEDPQLRLVELFGAQAALAIAYHHSFQAMLRVGLREDHQRIARELHDGIVQKLYGLGLQLEGTLALTPDPLLQRQLDSAISDIDQVVGDLRAYMRELTPAPMANPQLEQGLRELASDVSRRTHLAVDVDVDEALASRLADQTQSLLLIASERLADLERRADITMCTIRLREDEDLAVLEIEDDGRGVHIEAEERLRKINEQTAELNAEVEVEVVPEVGAKLRARIADTDRGLPRRPGEGARGLHDAGA